VIVPDVNLLLYATIDGFPQHERARTWWEEVLSGEQEVGLTVPSTLGFLRVATHRRVLERPMSLAEAGDSIRGWLGQPFVSILRPGVGHLGTVLDLLDGIGTAGNLTTDAQIAAAAVEHGGTVSSADSDFARFTGVAWVNPLSDAR